MGAIGIDNPLFFVGVVEDIVDPRFEGRVKVRAFGIHGNNQDVPTEDLPWAIVCRGDYDPSNWIPRENYWVFGMFLDGREAQSPMVLGLIPTINNGVNPKADGYGVIPNHGPDDGYRTAYGSTPEDHNQPRMSRLARGENLEETYVLAQEMARNVEITVAAGQGEDNETLEEPPTAYNTRYPHNRVISSATHSIELDDTPGSERIMIYHKDGSFYQISQGGLVVEKASGNKWEITDLNEVKVVKGQSTVTINGDARIRVEGNKIEEIMGDYQQIVHGNSYITSGGEMTLNASDRLQARGGDIRLDANVGTFSYYAEKEIQFEAGVGMYFKSPFMWLEAPSNMNIRANNLNMSAVTDLNIRANGGDLNLYGSADVSIKSNSQLKADANGNISITTVSGSTVFINDNVDMANGGGASATDAVYAEQSISSERVESPEPPAKAMPIRKSQNTASGKPHGDVGSTHGVASGDDQVEGGVGGQSGVDNTVSTSVPTSPISSAVGGMLGPLLDLIGNAESGAGGYDAIWGSQGIPDNSGYVPTFQKYPKGISFSDYPDKRLTLMTIQEVLNWQESIDKRYNSEASGRYQFMEDTLRGYNNDNNTPARDSLAEQAGLSLSDKFSPENQDKMATVLLQFAGLNAFLNGSKSLASFGNGISGIWAKVPRISGPGAGTGSYDNDGQNKADPNLGGPLRTILTTLKATYDASI